MEGAPVLKAGFSQTDITPPDPREVFQDGYGSRFSPAEGVRDPLYAKVCYLASGDSEFAVISFDLCGLGAKVLEKLCALISLVSGMPREKFALCATHTHAAPGCGVLEGAPVNPLYFDEVGRKAARALTEAKEKAAEGVFRASFGDPFEAGYNRRKRNEIDRRVFVWSFFDARGGLRGALASVFCHAVCNTNMLISADYPGVLTLRSKEKLGEDVPVLFLQGRGADIDPKEYEETGLIKTGAALCESVFSGLDRAGEGWTVGGIIKSAFMRADIPFAAADPESVRALIEKYTKRLAEADSPIRRRSACVELFWAYRAKKNLGRTPTVSVDLQMLRIGDAAVAFVPFEMLTVTGDAIEKILLSHGVRAPGCLVVGYANGTNGYLCPSAEAGEKNYETSGANHWYGLPECSSLTETAVLDGFRELSGKLFPG
ncbi:MAG: hypothetical protein IJV00_08880 [Clostridia bacterium]|nr:hypothetical protein [Clostridia bacterium]